MGKITWDSTFKDVQQLLIDEDGIYKEYVRKRYNEYDFKGVMDNTEVFFGMVRALGLDGNKTVKSSK